MSLSQFLAPDYSSSLPTYWEGERHHQPMDSDTTGDQHDWLRELADIATGPHSPLLQNNPEHLSE